MAHLPAACTTVSLARNPPDDVLSIIRWTFDLSLEKMYNARGLSLREKKTRQGCKGQVCIRTKWPIRLELIAIAGSNYECFYSPLDGTMVHCRVTSRVERSTVRVKCLGKGHNTISQRKARRSLKFPVNFNMSQQITTQINHHITNHFTVCCSHISTIVVN